MSRELISIQSLNQNQGHTKQIFSRLWNIYGSLSWRCKALETAGNQQLADCETKKTFQTNWTVTALVIKLYKKNVTEFVEFGYNLLSERSLTRNRGGGGGEVNNKIKAFYESYIEVVYVLTNMV